MALTRRQKREEARRLFLTGTCDSNAEIARRLGMKAHTVARYRNEENWDELRLKVDRRAAESMVEQLAGERTNLNLRHFRYWEAILAEVGEVLKTNPGHGVRDLEKLATIVDRAQKGQRLARGLSLSGENEEQIRAQAHAESRALVDSFIEAVKAHVHDEATRDEIRLTLLGSLPSSAVEEPAETPS